MENTSGQGKNAAVPDEIKGWNWAAFTLNVAWGIAHKVYISLFCLVPYAGLLVAIFLGLKGSELAWRNKRWESIAQFQRVQRLWLLWGAAIVFLVFAGAAIGVIFVFKKHYSYLDILDTMK